LLATVEQWMSETPHILPSTRSTYCGFEPKRYWRGPVWLHMNWMIALGCARAGRRDLHDEIHTRTLRMIEAQGFHEYYDPHSGDGLGGKAFSWAAASMLAWRCLNE
jgi:glycogen debranching enzyme